VSECVRDLLLVGEVKLSHNLSSKDMVAVSVVYGIVSE
jgi:hypothetical protein